jgi:hypothetical protein
VLVDDFLLWCQYECKMCTRVHLRLGAESIEVPARSYGILVPHVEKGIARSITCTEMYSSAFRRSVLNSAMFE